MPKKKEICEKKLSFNDFFFVTWMTLVDFVGGSGQVHFFGPAPKSVVQGEVPHLTVQFVFAHVAFDEIVRGPFYGIQNLRVLI